MELVVCNHEIGRFSLWGSEPLQSSKGVTMASGPMQFGNNGVGNDSGLDRTTLDSNNNGPTFNANNPGGIAVLGFTEGGIGLMGDSQTGDGVQGISRQNIGVFGGSGSSAGVKGRSAGSNGIEGETTGAGWAGAFFGRTGVVGNLSVFGNLTVIPPGVKSMAMRHLDGSYRRLYTLECPESWFEDFGRGELVEGRAQVELDPEYAAMVDLEDYHVFLTPEGDSAGLYVNGKTSAGFEVREQQGGTSSLTFSYRMAARRKDISGERLAHIDEQDIVPPVQTSYKEIEIASPDNPGKS